MLISDGSSDVCSSVLASSNSAVPKRYRYSGDSSARAGRSIRPPLSGLCAYAAPRAFAARDSTSEAAPVSVPLDRGDDFQGAGCLNRRADHRPESSRRFRHRGPRASLRPSHGCSGSANEEEAVMFRSEEHTSELQSLMRISYAVFCLTKQQIPTLSPTPI